ncbi:Beta-galactosidase BgaP [compost metagenome]
MELAQRSKDGIDYHFVLNHNGFKAEVELGEDAYLDLLANEIVTARVELEPYGVLILQKQQK